MVAIYPLTAVRPDPARAADVASVPYDVCSRAEAKALAAGKPDSFLHVVRPEIDLPDDVGVHDDAVYAQGPKGLAALLDSGALLRDEEPAIYLYRQTMGDHSQVGVVCCSPVDDYDEGRIKLHEKTRPDKEDDRTRHVLTLSAHAGPVFLTYRGTPAIDAAVAAATRAAPLYDFTAPDGVGHTVWRVAEADCGAIVDGFTAVPATYVADGHHRAKSASRAREARRAANPEHTGDERYNRFLTVLFPADQLAILPYNRHVHDLNGRSADEFLAALGEVMTVTEDADPSPAERGRFAMYLGGRWYGLQARPERLADPDPVDSLDAAILQADVLAPLLGIDNPRTSKRIDFVGGIRGTGELAQRVDAMPGSVAFSLYPVSVEQLLSVADAGRVLPPKSTWFEPKLRSGLLVHQF